MTNQLSEKILKLKKEKNAIILAHLYQIPEIQEIADYVGDSYYLSQVARDAKEDLIIFCGVKFMAESAKVLSPEKTVILPAPNAGCPMADMAEVEDVQAYLVNVEEAFGGIIKKDMELKHINADTKNALRGSVTMILDVYADVKIKNEQAIKVLKTA